jgi:hypothetical protein
MHLSRGPALALLMSIAAASFSAVAFAQHAPRSLRATRPPESPVVQVIARIASRLRSTRYVHATHIVEAEGRFDFDCSAMAAWVLARATPHAHATVMTRNGRGRPVAANYHDVIAAAPHRTRAPGLATTYTRVTAPRG